MFLDFSPSFPRSALCITYKSPGRLAISGESAELANSPPESVSRADLPQVRNQRPETLSRYPQSARERLKSNMPASENGRRVALSTSTTPVPFPF
jgi:hypothetical protein